MTNPRVRWAVLVITFLLTLMHWGILWALILRFPSASFNDSLLGIAISLRHSTLLFPIFIALGFSGVLVWVYSKQRRDIMQGTKPSDVPKPTAGRIVVGFVIAGLALMVVWLWSALTIARAKIESVQPLVEPYHARGVSVIVAAGRTTIRVGLVEHDASDLKYIADDLKASLASSPPLTIRLYAEDGADPKLIADLFMLIQELKPERILLYRLKSGVSVYDDFLLGDSWPILHTLRSLQEPD
ncbi:MAG: hypothetical protein WD768_00935 [Phycisphaeraceae bacterium]